jgi:hypothetical protein
LKNAAEKMQFDHGEPFSSTDISQLSKATRGCWSIEEQDMPVSTMAAALNVEDPSLRSEHRYGVLRRLRQEGWRVRLKRDVKPRQAASSCGTLNEAIRAALLAYQHTLQTCGEQGLPCRAALKAYRDVRPHDVKSGEYVARALMVAMRKRPRAFSRTAAMAG